MPAMTDGRVAEYYKGHPEQFQAPERVQASHILVKVEDGAAPEAKAAAKKKIEGIQQKLKAGGDFGALAAENSDCPSKERGGDLGFFTKGQMVPEFEAAAFALKPGEVSGIVETKFGFHIIKCTEHSQAGATPLPEVKDRLRTFLENGDKRDLLQKKIAALRQASQIKMTAATAPAPKTPARP
jgi:peptidyl-prolyl cis-trans isomerase C